ncbi:NUDIX hydrolase [Leucothrix arctica]|uniref:NUDIX hydrolase n=1 Tax=Leucothrix arctica TaxID=1481894 RepID=A0A317CHD9_9GAMM|nr:NUDIX hydrolase [Leucothrix arctica]
MLELLVDYRMRCPEEAEAIHQLIVFVNNNPDCFERTLLIGHVTGSAWVVNQAGTHTLLTHHKKLNKWLQLGGHADGETDILKAALLEVEEESGLAEFEAVSPAIFDIDIHPIPARGDEPEHLHYDVRFAVRAIGSDDYIVSDESHDLSWVETSRISEYTQEESMLRMSKKWLSY